MICPTCSADVPAGNSFCVQCGNALPAPATTIDTARFALLRKLHEAARSIAPEQRQAFLQSACGGDMGLLSEIYTLLAREQETQQQAARAHFIGPYRLLRELGRGGMGVVFLAMRDDGAFQKQVAIKLVLRDQVTPDFVQRFRNERQVLATLDHPNIARILDGGDAPDGMPYYVMEFVEGTTLDKYCEDAKLGLAARLRLLQQICQAVEYLHRCQVVHRDLKPGNILVSHDGQVKLLDFGIAKTLVASNAPDLTSVQSAPMTPIFASPEQMAGLPVTGASDIYSLGVIAYRMLTGRSPFEDVEHKFALIMSGKEPPPPSSAIRPDLLNTPETTQQLRRRMIGDLDQIILKTLRRNPEDRYASAAALAEDIQCFLDGRTVAARPGSVGGRMAKALRRNWIWAAVAACFVLLLGAGGWMYQRARVSEARIADMQKLLDQLEKAPAEKVSPMEVASLRKELESPAPKKPEVLTRTAQYLEKVRPRAATDPALAKELAATYQRLGEMQQGEPARANFERAVELLRMLPDDQRRLEDVERRVAYLEQRLGRPSPAAPAAPATVPVAPAPAAAKFVPLPAADPPPPVAIPVAAPSAPAAPAAAVERRDTSEIETRLVGIVAKAEIAESAVAKLQADLQRQGLSAHPSTLDALNSMRSAIARAKRQVASGEADGARDSLAAAEVYAQRALKAAGR